MSGQFANLFDFEGLMDDPMRRGMLGMGASLLGDSGYSRVPVTLGQALGRGFLQGLDQYGEGRKARLAADAKRALETEKAAKRAKAQFEQDLMLEKFGFEKAKFAHTQAKDAQLQAVRDRLLKRLLPSVASAPPVPPVAPGPAPAVNTVGGHQPAMPVPDPAMAAPAVDGTGSPGEPVGQTGVGNPPGFPLSAEQAMAMKAAGLPDFTDDVAAHRRHQFDEKKLAYQQEKDARDFDYKLNEKRIDGLRVDRGELADMPARYQRLLDAEALIDQGIYSGSWPQRVAYSLNQFIPMDREGLARTEAFVSLMGREALEIVKQLGSGTAISDADRIYAQEIAGGSLATSERGLRKILGIAKREMNRRAQAWNTQLPNRLKGMEQFFPEDLRVTLPAGDAPGQALPLKAPGEMTDDELNKALGL